MTVGTTNFLTFVYYFVAILSVVSVFGVFLSQQSCFAFPEKRAPRPEGEFIRIVTSPCLLLHLVERWVPGTSREFHCGQTAPRWNMAPMAGKSLQAG